MSEYQLHSAHILVSNVFNSAVGTARGIFSIELWQQLFL